MKNKAMNALIDMGMPADIKGFRYISEIMEIFENEEFRMMGMVDLYKFVGKQNDTTSSQVERAIRHAFSVVLEKGNLETVGKYLTFQHPTNGNLLHTFYIRLKQEG